MKLHPAFDPEYAAHMYKRPLPARSIALLMLLVAVSSVFLAVGRGVMDKPVPLATSSIIPTPVAVPAVLHYPLSPPAQPPDRFVQQADALIDSAMVSPAPVDLDQAMVIKPDTLERATPRPSQP
jgi:hypothetical protein